MSGEGTAHEPQCFTTTNCVLSAVGGAKACRTATRLSYAAERSETKNFIKRCARSASSMGRKQQPVTQSAGAFYWHTSAYADFNTLQKIIFWLWPIATLVSNYVFIAYWFIVFLGNRKKPLEERRETYIRALYYYNIFWLCMVAILIVIIALSTTDPSDACTTFYCESQVPYGDDNRCENPAYILGADDSCHPPCGATDEYCTAVNSYCYRNECVSCPSRTELYKDGSCYESA